MSLVRLSRGLATTTATAGAAGINRKIAVIGGGASGIFASIAAATASSEASSVDVHVLEATSQTLAKVKISGGGRCNVLHDTRKPVPQLLATGYPRGRRELHGPYSDRGFSPTRARTWFEAHGVCLKTEADGRMFPVTDSSQTVTDALHAAAREGGVQLRLRCKVNGILRESNDHDGGGGDQLVVNLTEKASHGASKQVSESFDAVILATGSAPLGYQLASQLGHSIVSPVPSLFTLNTKDELQTPDGRFVDLAGVSVPWARISLKIPATESTIGAATTSAATPTGDNSTKSKKKKKAQVLQEEGPLLITHHGLSGPAALRLSAFGAREWNALGYRADVTVHWAPHLGTTDDIFEELWKFATVRPKKTIASVCPLAAAAAAAEATDQPDQQGPSSAIPRRLWAAQCRAAGVAADQVWGQVPKKTVRKLAMQVSECVVHVTGKGQFKEEFVTAGGVALKEIDMKTMQSKMCDGLYLCGEVIDVDGVTGGYNFQNAWTTGFLAGTNAAISLIRQDVAIEG